ncbi:MAG: tetratricopeptide repeat protein [Magnetococcales bacterium]|nr:tetratricopeptide repeat protein [Magnetococcales bacterium]
MREQNIAKVENQLQLTIDDAHKLAMDHFKAKNYTEADKICTAIIQSFPNHIGAINLLGIIAVTLNYNELAIEQFQKAISIKPDDPNTFNFLGNAQQRQGLFDEAIKSYQQALSIEPEFVEAHLNLGNILVSLNKNNKAIESYQKILIIKPGFFEVLIQLGVIQLKQGKLAEAIYNFQKAIDIKPDYAEAYLNLGVALQKSGKLEEAIFNYQKAITNQPNFALAYYNIGDTQQELDKLEEAIKSYQKALLINPNFAEAYLKIGKCLQKQEKLIEAVCEYKKAIAIRPDYVEVYDNLIKAITKQGKLDKELLFYNEEIVKNPNLPVPHLCIGLIHFYKSEYWEAVPYLNKALDLDPKLYTAHFYLFQVYYNWESFSFLALTHLSIANHFNSEIHDATAKLENVTRDSLFLCSSEAFRVAKLCNRVETGAVDAPQICYYFGDEIKNSPSNLINLKHENSLYDFFSTTRLRLPKKIIFDPANKKECDRALNIANNLANSIISIQNNIANLVKICASTAPGEVVNGKMRVLVSFSRETVVLQTSLKGIAQAFEKSGHHIKIITENNDMEKLDSSHSFHEYLKDYLTFKPHVVVNIDHLNNSWLHPDVFNVVWWQDSMPEIAKGKPLPWRERDLIFSLLPEFDLLLKKCGAYPIHRQGFCVSTSIFRNIVPLEERKKVVFVGSSYSNKYDGSEKQKIILDHLYARFTENKTLSRFFLEELSLKLNYFDTNRLHLLANYVCRDTMVEWLSELGYELDLNLEIYGKRWEGNPKTKPFYRGILKPGKEVSRVYNEAKYALSCHPATINSQRLVEIAASGAIPIVYDARPETEPPHWEDECLLIRTKEDMRQALTKKPKKSHETIPKMFSFDLFVDKILYLIKRQEMKKGFKNNYPILNMTK